MYSSNANMKATLGDFIIEGMLLRYTSFVPRFYNFCKSLGLEPGKMLPSRAFCSDESQGYPVILLAKHFGTFPFNHGRVGGIVATDRHGPHAEHGKDIVIVHASHVGYDPDSHTFGTYRRMQTEHQDSSANCGKVESVLEWYLSEYAFAKDNIFLERQGNDYLVTIDNQLLRDNRPEGLFLNMERMVASTDNGESYPIRSLSTAKCYLASKDLRTLAGDSAWPESGRSKIGDHLRAELFRFKRPISEDPETHGHLEQNLIYPMAWIVTSPAPLLTAAQVNTQVEFDRTHRTLVQAEGYRGKKVVFISGLHIDISPRKDQLFPLTKFVPWAGFVQERDGNSYVLEQKDLMDRLLDQPEDNPDKIDLTAAIHMMEHVEEVKIRVPKQRD